LASLPGFASGLNRADAAAWRETHCAKNKSKQPQAVVACFVKLAGVCCAPMTPTTEQLSQVVRVLADHVLLMDKYVLALAEARESQNQFIATRMPGLTTRPERWHAACFPNEIDLHVRIANRLRLSKLPATGVGESPWGWPVWKFRPINQ